MSEYVRPHFEPVEYLDAHGEPIDYGNRWEHLGGVPPEDSYSVDDHPERFAPLHAVAEALIDHLVANYEVDVEEGYHVTDGMQSAPKEHETVRAVKLTPRDEHSAALVFVLTNYPSVRISAGVLFDDLYPVCGCNACDEIWEALADGLEQDVFAIIGGGFTERVSEPRRAKLSYDREGGWVRDMGQTVSYEIRELDGSGKRGGAGRAESLPKPIVDAAIERLDALVAANPAGNWLPWPRRDSGDAEQQ